MKLLYPLGSDIKFITQHYGENPEIYSKYSIGGVKLKGHEGVDYRAENGTQVVACDGGFCQEALDQGKTGYGQYIKLVHEWGESIYAHLQEFKIKQSNQVKKGQVIALSDNTGNSTGPHLHFGIRINPYNRGDGWGGYSDPEPYLEGRLTTLGPRLFNCRTRYLSRRNCGAFRQATSLLGNARRYAYRIYLLIS